MPLKYKGLIFWLAACIVIVASYYCPIIETTGQDSGSDTDEDSLDIQSLKSLLNKDSLSLIRPLSLCYEPELGLPQQMDLLLTKLADALERGRAAEQDGDVIEGLNQVLGLNEIFAVQDNKRPLELSNATLKVILDEAVLGGDIEQEEADKLTVSIQLVGSNFSKLPVEDRAKIMTLVTKRTSGGNHSSDLSGSEAATANRYPRRSLRKKRSYHPSRGSLVRMAKKVIVDTTKILFPPLITLFTVGFRLWDFIYVRHEFFIELPIIGERIAALKRAGEPLRKVVDFVRSMHYLYKVSNCKQNEDDCNEVNHERVADAERVVTDVGLSALLKISNELMVRHGDNFSAEQMQALAERTSELILTFAIPSANADCLPSK